MLDIVEIPEDGRDMGIANSIVPKAGNVLSVQLGSLTYAPRFGVDLKYFLETPIRFQAESFKAYCVERLTQSQINVASVLTEIEALFQKNIFLVSENEETEGLII